MYMDDPRGGGGGFTPPPHVVRSQSERFDQPAELNNRL